MTASGYPANLAGVQAIVANTGGADATIPTFTTGAYTIGTSRPDTWIATDAAETFDGDAGADTVSYDGSSEGVTVDLAAGAGKTGYGLNRTRCFGDARVHANNLTFAMACNLRRAVTLAG